MKDLQDATERICELKGSLIALDVLVTALLTELPPAARQRVFQRFASHAEVARTVLLNGAISEVAIASFERDVQRIAALDAPADATGPATPAG